MKTIIFRRDKMNGKEIKKYLEQWMDSGVEDLRIRFVLPERKKV